MNAGPSGKAATPKPSGSSAKGTSSSSSSSVAGFLAANSKAKPSRAASASTLPSVNKSVNGNTRSSHHGSKATQGFPADLPRGVGATTTSKIKATASQAKSQTRAKNTTSTGPPRTPRTAAARQIKAKLFAYLAQAELVQLREEEILYQKQLREADRLALEAEARIQHRRYEREVQKRVEEMRKRKKFDATKKRLFDAAYEGPLETVVSVLEENPGLLETKDTSGYTVLSEAANGGQLQIVKHLVQLGANVNALGGHRRTPLWRAAFVGEEGEGQIVDTGHQPHLARHNHKLVSSHVLTALFTTAPTTCQLLIFCRSQNYTAELLVSRSY